VYYTRVDFPYNDNLMRQHYFDYLIVKSERIHADLLKRFFQLMLINCIYYFASLQYADKNRKS